MTLSSSLAAPSSSSKPRSLSMWWNSPGVNLSSPFESYGRNKVDRETCFRSFTSFRAASISELDGFIAWKSSNKLILPLPFLSIWSKTFCTRLSSARMPTLVRSTRQRHSGHLWAASYCNWTKGYDRFAGCFLRPSLVSLHSVSALVGESSPCLAAGSCQFRYLLSLHAHLTSDGGPAPRQPVTANDKKCSLPGP